MMTMQIDTSEESFTIVREWQLQRILLITPEVVEDYLLNVLMGGMSH